MVILGGEGKMGWGTRWVKITARRWTTDWFKYQTGDLQ